MFVRKETPGTARTLQTPALIATQPNLRLSEAAAQFMLYQAERGLAERTLNDQRADLWSVFEFVACDAPLRELAGDTSAKYLDWLRKTPVAPRKSKTLAKIFSPASVAGFFAWPPRRRGGNPEQEKFRGEQTIGRYWRHVGPFFAFLGLPTELKKRDRPNMALPPPLVPTRSTVREWWQDALSAKHMPPGTKRRRAPSAAERRRVLLTQGLILLSGMRIDEALSALTDDVEGHWLLVRESKTHQPRILYLNSQALGLVAALHPPACQRMLFVDADPPHAEKSLTGWGHTISSWHNLVRDCKSPQKHDPGEKRHQCLRRVLSTWLYQRDPVAESAQMGHGSGVVYKHYLDVLRRLPRILERYTLPTVEGFVWPPPIDPGLFRPDRLYNEFRRLVSRRR